MHWVMYIPKYWHISLYEMKNHICRNHQQSHQKLSIGMLSNSRQIKVCQIPNSCLKSQVQSLATNAVSCFPGSLCSFLSKCLPDTQPWISIVCLPVVLSVKTVFHENCVDQQATQSQSAFILLWLATDIFIIFSFCPRIFNWVIFTISSRTFLSEMTFFLKC